jgi:hypothetical protein
MCSGTNFSRVLDSLLILSITAQSIFVVEPSVWARWEGTLTGNASNNNYKKKTDFIIVITADLLEFNYLLCF